MSNYAAAAAARPASGGAPRAARACAAVASWGCWFAAQGCAPSVPMQHALFLVQPIAIALRTPPLFAAVLVRPATHLMS